MTGDGGSGRAPRLLERDEELNELDAAGRAAVAGTGAIIAITGAAGAGKTSVLELAGAHAATAGLEVRVARASELESGFAFGVARQLLDGLDPGEVSETVAPALVALLGAPGAARATADAVDVIEGLTGWLAARSARRPMVLLIDDVQWLDPPSARWLDHLRMRIVSMRVVVAMTIRQTWSADLDDALLRVLADPATDEISLRALSDAAISDLLVNRLGRDAGPSMVQACARATAGNPFAVCELIAALELDGSHQTDLPAELLRRVPVRIARSIRVRLRRLGEEPLAVARALAVLGDGAPLYRVAELARLNPARASVAADRLISGDLLAPARPLAFVHPLVRSAIEDELASGLRARLHAEAAELLAREDADPEAVGAHLLRGDAVADPTTVVRLRRAAAVALQRGAPDVAVVYLDRAHAEPPVASQRVEVLGELGHAELLARAPTGRSHLAEAFARAVDPIQRARVGIHLFDAMAFAGDWRAALELVTQLSHELGDLEPDLALALDLRRAMGLLERDGDPAELSQIEARARQSPAARPLLLLVALVLASRGQRCGEVPGLVAAGLDGDRFLGEHGADSMLAVHAIDALVFIDALPEAHALAEAVCADAQRRGLVLGRIAGHTHRGLAALRGGQLTAAERDLRDAWAAAREHALAFTLPFIGAYLAETLAAQGRLDEAVTVLGTVPERAPWFAAPATVTFLSVRGAVRLSVGDRAGAITDLRECGRTAQSIGLHNPLIAPWRSTLARALVHSAPEEADELIDAELALSCGADLARGAAVALRSRAALPGTCEPIATLREAQRLLEDSPATLERARVVADLGASLRRAGRIADARAQLREALHLAGECEASGLVGEVVSELRAAGLRPRRPWLRGIDALTPRELRVAQLAARGYTNAEIATQLVISIKTVKHHLGVTFQKLDINSRGQLDAGALDGAGLGETDPPGLLSWISPGGR